MGKYNTPRYDGPRRWIQNKRERNTSWNDLRLACKQSEEALIGFISTRVEEDDWPEMSVLEWAELVTDMEEIENKQKDLIFRGNDGALFDVKQDNGLKVPENERSCWQLYKKSLDWKTESIQDLEDATIGILRRLSINTQSTGPIKGLVVGHVQSGKTANMAGLMAMAADWGWNMFIVLSGTIENLRIQTQARLQGDLNNEGSILSWQGLEHLSLQSPIGSRAQDLHFESNSKIRYFTVSLKNAARLKKLIQWLKKDKNKMAQMKILVIDDEADQAGINTAPISSSVKRPIYRLITAMVNGLNEKSQHISERYMAMNYIGYTATPYANILNDSSLESLYPKNGSGI